MSNGSGHVGDKVKLLRLGICLPLHHTFCIITDKQQILRAICHRTHQKIVMA